MPQIKSENFYIRVQGSHALFTTPYTKGGGEAVSYAVPTKQALIGIVDACYWKPVLKNVVEEVKVINPIRTQVRGSRALLKNGKADLNYISYLVNVEYLVKYHFIWNEDREDLIEDRNFVKHTEIVKRSLKKGGRRDVFLGRRECVGYVEYITKEEYEKAESYYKGEHINFGLMFNSFIYPKKSSAELISTFSTVQMKDGLIKFKESEECEIKNTLSNYSFKYPQQQKNVDDEIMEYNNQN